MRDTDTEITVRDSMDQTGRMSYTPNCGRYVVIEWEGAQHRVDLGPENDKATVNADHSNCVMIDLPVTLGV